MADSLQAFISGKVPVAEETESWGAMPLRIESYLSHEEPPITYITSVRGVVIRDRSVLVYWDDRDQPQILVGGRCEPGETLEQTLRREVLEEAGVEIRRSILIGFLHYRHLGPKPAGYAYPFPDFVQAVYAAQAGRDCPQARMYDEYVRHSSFIPVDDVEALTLRDRDRPFLVEALSRRLGKAP
jgi:8-oxo-dGTP pyrophosphatase MutT (NUDIX family)